MAGLLAVMLAITFLLWKQWTTGTHFMQSRTPECPHEWTRFTVKNVQHQEEWSAEYDDGLSVPGPITSVPEYHDCQRLILNGNVYGPLSAVFVSHRLEAIIDTLAMWKKTPGRFVDSTAQLTRAFAVAEVFQQDGNDYTPLGMRRGFNCLHLYLRAGNFEARMVPVGMNEAQCAVEFDPTSAAGKVLSVNIVTLSGFTAADYPPVARWDRDNTGAAYIGLKCHAIEWCQIGATASAALSAEYLTPSTDVTPDARVRRIKGWYDEQYLAVPAASDPSQLVVGAVRGTVFPAPGLTGYTEDDYRKWVETGYIATEGASAHYKNLMNADDVPRGSPFSQMTKIEMCVGTAGDCEIPSGYNFPNGTCGMLNSIWSRLFERYWARFTSTDGSVMYRCVIRRSHDKAVTWVPGTARWRWMVSDETIWEECTRGCCEVEVNSS